MDLYVYNCAYLYGDRRHTQPDSSHFYALYIYLCATSKTNCQTASLLLYYLRLCAAMKTPKPLLHSFTTFSITICVCICTRCQTTALPLYNLPFAAAITTTKPPLHCFTTFSICLCASTRTKLKSLHCFFIFVCAQLNHCYIVLRPFLFVFALSHRQNQNHCIAFFFFFFVNIVQLGYIENIL